PVDRRRSTRACRLVCTLCSARIGHASADRTDAEPRGDGSLSLRAQSYLRCPCRRHSGPSGLVRRPAPSSVRCVGVARLPRVCRGLRGADAKKIIRGGIRSFPHQCAALDPAPDRVARRSVAAVADSLALIIYGLLLKALQQSLSESGPHRRNPALVQGKWLTYGQNDETGEQA